MALIVLEGLDRTGKTTVAKYFESQGYNVIHMSAPPKGTTSDDFLQQMVDIVSSSATENIVLDRSYYGEALIWPTVYGRQTLMGLDDLDAIREIETSIGDVKRILMSDPNVEEHWQRCVDNNEPLTKAQFVRAKSLYSSMASKYQFEIVTLAQFFKQFPDAKDIVSVSEPQPETVAPQSNIEPEKSKTKNNPISLLDKANAINAVLKKRLIKDKGDIFDELENDIREHLLNKLSSIFGKTTSNEDQLTVDEIRFYKTMYKKAMKKEK